MASTGDLAYNPGMYPDWELNWRPFGLQPMLNPLSYTSQGLNLEFLNCILTTILSHSFSLTFPTHPFLYNFNNVFRGQCFPLVQATIISHLNYCNSLLTGLLASVWLSNRLFSTQQPNPYKYITLCHSSVQHGPQLHSE